MKWMFASLCIFSSLGAMQQEPVSCDFDVLLGFQLLFSSQQQTPHQSSMNEQQEQEGFHQPIFITPSATPKEITCVVNKPLERVRRNDDFLEKNRSKMAGSDKNNISCNLCSKVFNSPAAFDQHKNFCLGKKHSMRKIRPIKMSSLLEKTKTVEKAIADKQKSATPKPQENPTQQPIVQS